MKFLARVLVALFALFLFVRPVAAESEFLVDSKVEYKVEETGKSLVTHEIVLENNFSTLYATSYSLTLEHIDANNVKAYTETGQPLMVDATKVEDTTTIKVTFNTPVVGRGKQRHFFVTYENSNFAVKTGEIWEISIPKLSSSESFRNYDLNVKVPYNFGTLAYISPEPKKTSDSEGFKVYSFSKDDVVKTGITAGFGEFQVYTFTLNYHLENPLAIPSKSQIAVPPDTAFQKVTFRSINPQPSSIDIDNDGNYVATFNLKSRERVDVVVTGEVQIFSSHRHFPKPTQEILNDNLKPTVVWQSDHEKIKKLASELKTPQNIYNYVSTYLTYDYDRVRPNVDRLGALEALNNPNSAICMEFTDLFIALARAAGIPAREVNGYAYTENPKVQPLSLVADVLHSWPEYWDSTKNVWVPVDPTWGSTTGGVDFFSKLDLRHFTFVNHGSDSYKPYPPGSYKLGSNPQKDVFVSFGKLSEAKNNNLVIDWILKRSIPFYSSNLEIKIQNKSGATVYNTTPTIFFDKTEVKSEFVDVIPPYGEYKTNVRVPYSFLGKNSPETIRITAGLSEASFRLNKTKEVLYSILVLFSLFIAGIIAFLVKTGRIKTIWITQILSKITKRQ